MSMVVPLRACLDRDLVGGKAINLAKLLAAGFTVPDGVVITTEAFNRARPADGGFPQEVPPDLAREVEQAYQALGEPVVAVRSSATAEDLADASLAGQYDTILDVQGSAAVIDAIGRCWRSIDTPRTRSYLASKDIPLAGVSMAVVVQRLVPADVAGVLFTVNPRTGSADELLIEASWGLGEAVVSGIVQPDTLVVDSRTGVVLDARIADKKLWIEPGHHAQQEVPKYRRQLPCLSSGHIEQLRQLAHAVQAHFGSPQDLEWAIHDGHLYLLQSRAITSLGSRRALDQRLVAERGRLAELLNQGQGPWVLHNLSETLPHPTPLTWSVIRHFMSGNGGFGAMYRRVGFDPSPVVAVDGMLELIAGRIYLDASRGREMFFTGYPFTYDLALLRRNPDAAQDPPSLPQGGFAAQWRFRKQMKTVERSIDALAVGHDQQLSATLVPAFIQWVDQEAGLDLPSLSADLLLATWSRRSQRVLGAFAPESLLPSIIVSTALGRLRTFLSEQCWDEDPVALADLLAAGGEPNLTVQATAGLYALAHGHMTTEAWMSRFGHRAPEELDLATPRWRERPEAVAKLAAHLVGGADPLVQQREQRDKSIAAAQRIRSHLTRAQTAEFSAHLEIVQRYLPWREDGKHWLMLGYGLLRDVAVEAGRRLGIGNDVFLLSESELEQALRCGYAPLALIAARRGERAVDAKLILPPVIAAEELPALGAPPVLASGNRIPAFVISPGISRGVVRVVQSPENAGDLGTGYILVCPSTDPSWTPLFVNAAGLVLERGGALSHGAVVARELGIPAIVLAGATTLLSAGETVTIDGNVGALHRGGSLLNEPLPQPLEGAPPVSLSLTGTSSADDVTIDRMELPPPISQAERRTARWRNAWFLFWGIVLAIIFLQPYERCYDQVIRAWDGVLWPLVLTLGKPGAVALIAAIMAAGVVVLQRLMTDNQRLLVAKQRAGNLRKAASQLPLGSARRQALMNAALPVQWRIMGASFAPLAALLGPMIVSVCWLMDRCEQPSDRPGADVVMRMEVVGDATAPLTLTCDPGFELDEQTPATQSTPPIRATLERLATRWKADPSLTPDQPWDVRAAASAARTATLQDLRDYLSQPIPAQTLVWKLRAPTNAGHYHVHVSSADGGTAIAIPLAFGDDIPNEQREFLPDGKYQGWRQVVRSTNPKSGINQVLVVTTNRDVHSGDLPPAFWRPLSVIGWQWDAGWIWTYILMYLPVMFVMRWILRVA